MLKSVLYMYLPLRFTDPVFSRILKRTGLGFETWIRIYPEFPTGSESLPYPDELLLGEASVPVHVDQLKKLLRMNVGLEKIVVFEKQNIFRIEFISVDRDVIFSMVGMH